MDGLSNILQTTNAFVDGISVCVLVTMGAYFLWSSAKRPMFQRVYGAAMLMISTQIMFDVVLMALGVYKIEYYSNISALYDMTVLPTIILIFACVLSQTESIVLLITRSAVMGLPFIAFVLGYAMFPTTGWTYCALLYSALFVFCGAAYTIFGIRTYHRKLLNSYSDIEGRRLDWLYMVLAIILATMIDCYIVVEFLGLEYIFIHIIVSTAAWAYVGVHISRQRVVDSVVMEIADQKPAVNERTAERNEQIAIRLQERVVEKRMYVNPDLTIREVALELGTNGSYISAYLNGVLGKSFTTYINEMRMRDVEALLSREKDMSLEKIAQQTGFNSSATMNRVFAAKYGCSPSAYRQKLKDEMLNNEHSPANRIQRIAAETPELNPANLEAGTEEQKFRLAFTNALPGFKSLFSSNIPGITKREELIVMLIILGKDNDEICKLLGVEKSSLNVFRSRIRAKAGLKRKDSFEDWLYGLLEE